MIDYLDENFFETDEDQLFYFILMNGSCKCCMMIEFV